MTRILHYTGRRESLLVGRQQDSIPPSVFSVTFDSIGIGPRLQTLITFRDCLYRAETCKLRGSGKTPSFSAINSKILQGTEPTFNLQLPFLIPHTLLYLGTSAWAGVPTWEASAWADLPTWAASVYGQDPYLGSLQHG